ncbi:hypothetical protein BDV93DRAFT_522223, partial [Ceratobasidium sp. AG-I]
MLLCYDEKLREMPEPSAHTILSFGSTALLDTGVSSHRPSPSHLPPVPRTYLDKAANSSSCLLSSIPRRLIRAVRLHWYATSLQMNIGERSLEEAMATTV